MLDIVLLPPEIPPNTVTLFACAYYWVSLHLIGNLGIALDVKKVRRAGLDYHEICYVATLLLICLPTSLTPANSYFCLLPLRVRPIFEAKLNRETPFVWTQETRVYPWIL